MLGENNGFRGGGGGAGGRHRNAVCWAEDERRRVVVNEYHATGISVHKLQVFEIVALMMDATVISRRQQVRN
jgi:hypothetical protein